MKNFIFKSTDADLQKMFSKLDLIQRNVLYITHQVDFIRKGMLSMKTDKGLQSQVDEYFGTSSNLEDGTKDLPDSTEI